MILLTFLRYGAIGTTFQSCLGDNQCVNVSVGDLVAFGGARGAFNQAQR